MKRYERIFERIVSPEHLFAAWEAFRSDKQNKRDVAQFQWNLEPELFRLQRELASGRYRHGAYTSFYISDPKQRHIHKATVRDRVLHHAVFSVLNPIFEPTFIPASFSCRIGKGTHKAVDYLTRMTRSVSRNGTKACFVLKCDVQKFFASVDHEILLKLLQRRINDGRAMELLREIVGSFRSDRSTLFEAKGLPIGNLTSQLFANVYLNEFDQFVKHELRVQHYARYTDDFALVGQTEDELRALLPQISRFLRDRLALTLHPRKIALRRLGQGVDFLGYVVFPYHRLVRTRTRQRMFAKLRRRVEAFRAGTVSEEQLEQSLQSYRGVLSHASSYRLQQKLENQYWFWVTE